MTHRKIRTPHFVARCVLFAAALGIIFPTFPASAAYRPPDIEKKIFDVEKLKINKFDRAGLVGALVGVARDFNEEDHKVEYDTRSYALAIASRLDKDSSKVKDTLQQLKDTGETLDEANADKDKTASRIYSGVRALIRKKDNEDNLKCAAYCVDIALKFHPEGEKIDKLKEIADSLKKDGHKADWKGMLKSPITHSKNNGNIPSFVFNRPQQFTKVERTMPGGDAEAFARKQARVVGLSVRKLQSGKHAGAALPIRITALPEEGQDGILFKFDQKVGPMAASSIEEVIKFMRVRYEKDKTPDGYLIDITLGDKGLVDGPSAGMAFTLAIDSLFTGEDIDRSYAVTGTITSDGESGVIGGVAGKIRGAINKDCKIVGIPHGNAKGVYDSFLLDGMAPLLKINVFTQKTFDDAYKLSRVEKDSNIVTAMATYQRVADLVQKKGKDILKDPIVQKELEKVIKATPNHLCAKVLLDWSKGKHTKTLSLRGSLDEIDQEMSAFRMGGIKGDEGKTTAKEAVEHLEKIKGMLDTRMTPYLEALVVACKAVNTGMNEGEEEKDYTKRMGNLFRKAAGARSKILGDPKIVEEMNN